MTGLPPTVLTDGIFSLSIEPDYNAAEPKLWLRIFRHGGQPTGHILLSRADAMTLANQIQAFVDRSDPTSPF